MFMTDQKSIKWLLIVFALALLAACGSNQNNSSNTSREKQGQTKGQRGQRPSADQLITQMDSNKDGKLSKAEVKGPLANDFSKIDANNDGFISKTELENAPKPERNRQGGRPQRQ